MKLLDLFCCAGGAGMGYHKAGFEVTGVDIKSQPRYPFRFVQGDALAYLRDHGHEFDAIHASPPCQAHCALKTMWNYRKHESLIEPTRELLQSIGKPWIIENVEGAPLINPITLCGTMFGLQTPDGAQLKRHRLFETSFDILMVPLCHHAGLRTVGIYGDKARDIAMEKRHYSKPKETRGRPPQIQFSLGAARAAMGIEWGSMKELSQAIPPAYTEFIGRELQKILNR
jgi:DNA (cytosine-5)-methyltransferase 1